jgi:IclR family acetate operon transcriptional repressor
MLNSQTTDEDSHGLVRGGVQSVDRALEILVLLSESDEPQGITELARSTGLPHSTLHRLLASLIRHGYARQERSSRKYTAGSGLIRLAARAGRLLGNGARPYLADLAASTGETANLAVLDDTHVVYVAQVESRYRMRMFTEVGNRVLPHATAVGKVLLAALPEGEVERIISQTGLPAKTPRSITDPAQLRRELLRVADTGFALDDEEQEIGVRCLAVPVKSRSGVGAAMSISAPAGRLVPAECDRIARVMQEIAGRASADIFGTDDR